ncbi:MAG: substrate-binding domain-containing protein [Thermodesulfobacteriota bacterium]
MPRQRSDHPELWHLWQRHTDVDLTTIRQNIYQTGNTSAEILINRIQRKGSDMVNQVIINSQLIIRESCGFKLRGYAR